MIVNIYKQIRSIEVDDDSKLVNLQETSVEGLVTTKEIKLIPLGRRVLGFQNVYAVVDEESSDLSLANRIQGMQETIDDLIQSKDALYKRIHGHQDNMFRVRRDVHFLVEKYSKGLLHSRSQAEDFKKNIDRILDNLRIENN